MAYEGVIHLPNHKISEKITINVWNVNKQYLFKFNCEKESNYTIRKLCFNLSN